MPRRIDWSTRRSRTTATYVAEQHCDPPPLAEPLRPRGTRAHRHALVHNGRVYKRLQVTRG